jgi:hypothetical protein
MDAVFVEQFGAVKRVFIRRSGLLLCPDLRRGYPLLF